MNPHRDGPKTDPALTETPPTVEDRGGFPDYSDEDLDAVFYSEPETVETLRPGAWTDHLATAAASLGGTVSRGPIHVSNPKVFTALWRAHLAKARSAGDARLAWTAGSLLESVQQGELAAAEIDLKGESWAIWVDLDGRLVGVAHPAATYLTGS